MDRPKFLCDYPKMPADPLSDVLSLLKPETFVAGRYDLGGKWSIRFSVHSGVKYFALVSGTAWIAIEGEADPLPLDAGDCVLVPMESGSLLPRTFPSNPLRSRNCGIPIGVVALPV
ncbi:cupin domain-containing protein [Phyllobacterium sp. CCNWLW109]|uniref:cupin domain-containing protein n=1 Tax=Phyllobacterium sp. CCNWLW109 TaxID=3127479 RepID=UPI0030777EF1